MSSTETDASTADRAAPGGWYTDPADPDGTTRRWWDGEAWTDRIEPGEGPPSPLPAWTRHHMAFVHHRWFHLVLVALVISVTGAALYAAIENTGTLVSTVAIASALVALAYGVHLDGRIRMHQVARPDDLLFAFVVGGLVGQAIVQTERLLPKDDVWSILAVGPIEEIAKLAVPVAMFAWGARRFRDPRAGLALVLASAAAFGIVETATYAYRGTADHQGEAVLYGIAILKPFIDPVIHMTITGVFAAVAWRAWHLRGRFSLSGTVLGTLVLTMAMHDLIDLTEAKGKALGGLVLAPALLVLYYLLFKHLARREVPPDAVGEVPPGWRPTNLPTSTTAAPKGDHPAESAEPAVRRAA
jgi:RsiW-degrading membrane proteinase PrsW (M82 family)